MLRPNLGVLLAGCAAVAVGVVGGVDRAGSDVDKSATL